MSVATTQHRVVSSENEALVLVNANDIAIGTLDKSACHDGTGRLHRAFSCFVFNPKGELLIHQRHGDKRLWPAYWSNSCCSHPRAGEAIDEAVVRRVRQELGLKLALHFLYKFEYRAPFEDLGTEHELCHVYAGVTPDAPVINTTEIADWRWISANDLDAALRTTPDRYTPWFHLEWQALRTTHAAALTRALET